LLSLKLAQRGGNRHRLFTVAGHPGAMKLCDERPGRVVDLNMREDRAGRSFYRSVIIQRVLKDLLNLYLAAFETKHDNPAVGQGHHVFFRQEGGGDGPRQNRQDEKGQHRQHARLLDAKSDVSELLSRLQVWLKGCRNEIRVFKSCHVSSP
jgi:hypothetical protein